MKIVVKNLGPIKEAKIDIGKKLTVFCGPNNSGKTYMAFLVYRITKSIFKFDRSDKNQGAFKVIINNKSGDFALNTDEIWNYRKVEIKSIKASLDSLYGVSNDFVSKIFGTFDLEIDQNKKDFQNEVLKMSFSNTIKFSTLNISILKEKGDSHVKLNVDKEIITKEEIEFIRYFLNSKINSLIAFYPFSTSHILPVERNSIYTFSKELSIKKQDFLDRAQDLGATTKKDPFHWLLKRSTRYPMPIKDGLEFAEDLNNYTKLKSPFFDIANTIESELLGGTVSISKEGEVLFSSAKAKSKKIPIHLSASIVKTLSSLVFYLKHIANKNDLIIIDEPELNLHPNNQVLLARFFARLVNLGFRLLISTHSDYIIREFNNLIMLSSDKKEIQKIKQKYEYKEDEQLKKDQISAYLFSYKNPNSRNVSIMEIPITKNGFDVKTIDETTDVLNDVSEELFYNLNYDNIND